MPVLVSGATTALVGTAVDPHLSVSDVPFTHPFGGDVVFYVAPDTRYRGLLDAGSRGAARTADSREYLRAVADAVRRGVAAPRGVIGVEIDRGLLPAGFRPRPPGGRIAKGDRVAVFGTWIVDCGHRDFHTEIHPPLALAVARGTRNGAGATSTLIARPFQVSERFDSQGLYATGEGLYVHLRAQVLGGSGPLSAFPEVSGLPFERSQRLTYRVAPPAPRTHRGEVLTAAWHFTVRSGVGVTVTPGAAGVKVSVTMDPTTYVPSPVPFVPCAISLARLIRVSPEVAPAVAALRAVPGLAPRLQGGILTACDPPVAPPTPAPLDEQVLVDNAQPYPVAGRLDIAWRRTP